MKIYQIHEYGGEYEDRYDWIVASYLSKEKAQAEQERLELEEEERRKCGCCPLYYCEPDCDGDCEKCNDSEYKIKKAKEYCDRYEPFDKNKHDQEECATEKCVNFYYVFDDSFFKTEEVDVIE